MRVLVTLLPAIGSLHPLVPLARALLDAGHQVRFACAASFRPSVAEHGFDVDAAGIDFLFSSPDYFPKLVAEAGVDMPDMARLTGHERHAWVTDNLFIRAAARRMLPDVLALAESWRPDVIVRESSEFSGCVAAEAIGIPHASVAAAADAALDRRDLTAAALEPLRSAAGLSPDPTAEMIYRHLHLSFMPASFFGSEARFPATTRILRHVDAPRPQLAIPAWWERLPNQPTVLASLGTVFFRTPGCTRRSLPDSATRSSTSPSAWGTRAAPPLAGRPRTCTSNRSSPFRLYSGAAPSSSPTEASTASRRRLARARPC